MLAPRQKAEFAAGLIVALASSDEKKAEVSAALARKSLTALTDKYRAQIEDLWDGANAEAFTHLNLVRQNNPKKPIEEILKRPDVQSALRAPYEAAAEQSEAILREAWEAAEKDAVQKTKGEFKLMKEDWKGHDVDLTLLDSLVADLYANAQAMRSRYHEALTREKPSDLKGITNDVRTRAVYSLSTAIWGVATQVRDSAINNAGLNKMWVAVLDKHTCSHCANLHGTIIGPGKQFPVNAGATKLKVYMGKLLGPPRHPNCRCILVPTKLKILKKN